MGSMRTAGGEPRYKRGIKNRKNNKMKVCCTQTVSTGVRKVAPLYLDLRIWSREDSYFLCHLFDSSLSSPPPNQSLGKLGSGQLSQKNPGYYQDSNVPLLALKAESLLSKPSHFIMMGRRV